MIRRYCEYDILLIKGKGWALDVWRKVFPAVGFLNRVVPSVPSDFFIFINFYIQEGY